MKSMTLKLYFPMLLLACGMALFAHTYSSQYQGMGLGANFSPVFYPRILLAIWIGLTAILVIHAALDQEKGRKINRIGLVIAMAFLITIAAVMMIQAGFLIAMSAFSMVSCRLLGYRRPMGFILGGMIFPVAIWYLFHEVLLLRLPVSPWFEGF